MKSCSPLRQSAAFHTAPAGAESGQKYSPLTTRANLSAFQKGRLSKKCLVFVPPDSMSGVPAAAHRSGRPELEQGKPPQNETSLFFFCRFLSIQVVSRGFPGPLRYVINSPGFLLGSSALAHWEYLNY